MKIKDVKVAFKKLGLTRPYAIAYKEITTVDQVVLHVYGDGGQVALGTANPSQAVVGESVEDCYQTLKDADWGYLVGQELVHPHPLCRETQKRFPQSPGAQCAVDVALHDLWGHSLGRPLFELLGAHHKALPTSITIGIKDSDQEMLSEADEYLGRGFRHIKLKLGQGLQADLRRTRVLCEHLGDRARVRVDINQAYGLDDLRTYCEQSTAWNLELIEQPLPAADGRQSAALGQEARALVYLDESVLGPQDAAAAIVPPCAAGGINIKLLKCGGIEPALAIASLATTAGLGLMWGCNDESVVSIAGALHAALASPATRFLDLDGSLDLATDVATGGFVIEGGIMRPAPGPGLGIVEVA